MRIISWNCNKSFRTKVKLISQLQPDIAVIQECEDINNRVFEDEIQPNHKFHYSTGGIGKIGIGLLSYTDYKFKVDNSDLEEVYLNLDLGIKCVAEGPAPVQLLGLWTGPHPDNDSIHYVHSVSTFLKKYSNWIKQNNTIILGDFNSNLTYDVKNRKSHEIMLNIMDEAGLCSAYHTFFREDQGKETRPTFYFHKKNESTQHIDHIFIPKTLAGHIKNIEIGTYDAWGTHSDHVPFILDIDYPR